jgi:hypothetical protein
MILVEKKCVKCSANLAEKRLLNPAEKTRDLKFEKLGTNYGKIDAGKTRLLFRFSCNLLI